MTVILGFGSTEEQYRKNVKADIKAIVEECLSDRFEKSLDVIFDTDILKEISDKVEAYATKTRESEREIHKLPIADRPERYSYIYIAFCADIHNLFFGISYSHLNSKYPLSPDGMALLDVQDSLWVSSFDVYDGRINIKLKK